MTLFNSFASFNGSQPVIIQSDGTPFHPTLFNTFGSSWATIKAQYKNDLTFLGSIGTKVLRIWAILNTFSCTSNSSGIWTGALNSFIDNFDEFLTAAGNAGVQLYVTLMATPANGSTACTTTLGQWFMPTILQDATTQDAWYASLMAFINRYKTDTRIAAYDIINEYSFIITNIQAGSQLCGSAGLTYDNSTFDATTALMSRIYTGVKAVDTLHPMTYSMSAAQPTGSGFVPTVSPYVDFFDCHMYSYHPEFLYRAFPSYSKPVIHGECGILGSLYNPVNGSLCSAGTTDNSTAMNFPCQTAWFKNSQSFVTSAQSKGVQHLFFSYFPASNWFFSRTDDGSGQWLGHQLTVAGNYLTQLNQSHPSSIDMPDNASRGLGKATLGLLS